MITKILKNADKNFDINIIKPVYYISGESSWLKKQCLDQIIKIINNNKPSCQFFEFDNKNISINNLLEICESIPLGADFKCIIIKDWELDKLSDKEMLILNNLVSDLAEFCCLIFINITKTKIKKFLDIIKKNGSIIELKKLNPIETTEYVVLKIKSKGGYISNKNARQLVEYCNNNLDKISQEINKLISFCKDKEISLDDIKALVIPDLEIRVFDLIKYISLRDKTRALSLLKNLLDNREEPIVILSIMSINFLDLYRAKVAKISQKSLESLVELFDYKGKEFRINKAFSQSDNYSFEQLKNIINLLIESDYKLKSSQVDKKIILETTILKLFSYLEAR